MLHRGSRRQPSIIATTLPGVYSLKPPSDAGAALPEHFSFSVFYLIQPEIECYT